MTTEATAAVADATTTTTTADAAADTQGELKKLIAQRDELKRKLREIEPLAARAKDLEQAQMTEAQKLSALVEELKPKAGKVERYEAVIGSLLESELATVPEDMRDIVPATLAPEERLAWLRQAKDKGLFKAQESAAPAPPKPTDSPLGTKPGATGKTIKRASFDTLPALAKADFVRSGGTVID